LTPEAESYHRGHLFNSVKQWGGSRAKEASAQIAHLKRSADALAQQFKLSRGTIRRDGQFAERVDGIVKASDDLGHEFRQRLLSRSLRLPAAEIKLLAAKGKPEIARLVGKLLEGESIDLGSSKASTVLRIALPRGKAEEQAQVLFKSLIESVKRPQLAKLVEELNRLLKEDNKEQVNEEGKEQKEEQATE
jgi:hypothetical protein